jgi:hypothetical protein
MTEKQWTVEVARLAKDFGWLRYHTHRSDFSPAGFPDECLVRPPRLIFAELKSDNPHSKLGPEQERWREQLQEVPGVEWYLWRPSDVDEVIRLLVPPGWKFT